MLAFNPDDIDFSVFDMQEQSLILLDKHDTRMMREAIRQAKKGLGRTSPNPLVGAVIEKDGYKLAAGYHRKAGSDHAEVDAIKRVKGSPKGATLYVTLEPCNHAGRTPPCTAAILKSGIRKVIVGMRDPNPNVTGGGCAYLEREGIEVKIGVLEEECARLNEAYIKYVTTGRPFVVLKSALTLDGWTGTKTGHSQWITNEKSRRFVHLLRDRIDAVLVGIGTVLADDPSLTTRLPKNRGRDSIRIVVDTSLRTPLNAKVVHHRSSQYTIIAVGDHIVPQHKLQRFDKKHTVVLTCDLEDGRISLSDLLNKLGERCIMSVMVEGGATIAGSFLREKLVDKIYVFKAPKILGGDDGIPMASGPGAIRMDQCLELKETRVKRFGEDLLISGYPKMRHSRFRDGESR